MKSQKSADGEAAWIRDYLKVGADARNSVDPKLVLEIGNEIAKRLLEGNKLIIMGNGGAAADSEHIAAEFVGRFEKERRAIPAIALNTNTASVTAIANDYGYDAVFVRQIHAFAKKGDVVMVFSALGNSANSVKAAEEAKKLGCYTIGFTGGNGGKLNAVVDKMLIVDSSRTSIIQEVHIAIGHIISKIVEDKL